MKKSAVQSSNPARAKQVWLTPKKLLIPAFVLYALFTVAISHAQYCPTGYTSGTTSGDFIDGVQMKGINNFPTGSQGGPEYNDYTFLVVDLVQGMQDTIFITSGLAMNDYYAVWIDYDQNGVFNEPVEKIGEVQIINSYTTAFISFTVPSSGVLFGITRMRVRCYNVPDVGPCNIADYGETEDYTVNIFAEHCGNFILDSTETGVDCGGPDCPPCGGPCIADFSFFTDTTLTVQFNDSSINAFYWWWDFDDGTEDSISSNPVHTYLSPGTYNVCLWIDDSASCSDSICKSVTVPAGPSYCIPDYTSGTSLGDFIDGVQLKDIDNTLTGGPGGPEYNDYTSMGTDLFRGMPDTVFITSGSNGNNYYSVWIDFDQNNVFDEPAEKIGEVQITGALQTVDIAFTVPGGAMFGPTRMRVRCSEINSVLPCASSTYGETEDYTVKIIAQHCGNLIQDSTETGIDCGGPDCPPCGIPCNADFSFFTDTNLTVQFSDSSINAFYWWWDFGDGAEDSISANPIHTYLSPGTYNVCLWIDDTAFCSDSICKSVTVPAGPSYCIPAYTTGTTSGDFIDGVELTNLFNKPTGSTGGPNYNDYMSMLAELMPNSQDTVFITGGSSTGDYYKVWIDYDQNGIFNDPGTEVVGEGQIFTSYGILQLPFIVSTGYPTGPTRMRVRCSDAPVGPCDTATFGETEDYTINMLAEHCGNFIQDSTETGVDCGGPDCPPCPCMADFGYEFDTLTTVSFFDSSSAPGAIMSWYWDFGDGNTDSIANPVHVFPDTGMYFVCLIIIDDGGCSDSLCYWVDVGTGEPSCKANFGFFADSTLTVQFSDSSVSAYYRYWDFDDGNVDSISVNPVHTYAAPGIYYVCLFIDDSAYTCFDSICKTFQVPVPPPHCMDSVQNYDETGIDCGGMDCLPCPGTLFADFNWNYICLGDSTEFWSISGGPYPIVSWEWDFNEDAVTDATVPEPTYVFPDTLLYNVRLIVTDSVGDKDTVIHGVKINECPQPCESDWNWWSDTTTAYFTNSSMGANYWAWDFNNDSITDASIPNPSYNFGGSGAYWVCLTIWNNDSSCSDTWCDSVFVGGGPVCYSDWYYNSDSTTAYFSNMSPGANYWAWDFNNDGTTDATNPNPVWNFGAPGVYWVCLYIWNNDSICTDTWCDSVYVGVMPPCYSDWGYSSDTSTAYFTDMSMDVAYWAWDFNNDGITDKTNPNPVWNFGGPGNYWVCLTIWNADSTCSDTWCDMVDVGTGGPQCESDWYYTSDTTNKVYFTNLSTGITPITWLWDFGDSTTSTAKNPVHPYSVPGTYWVCLTMTDVNGCTDTWCNQVNVGVTAQCNADWYYWTDTNKTAYFTNVSSGATPISYLWEFGDSTSSTAYSPVHNYALAGSYWACLTITDANGCTSTYCDIVDVGVGTQCGADWNYWADTSKTAYFTDMSTGNVIDWYWEFDDSVTSNIKNPVHTYSANGSYWVCLTITTADSCTDTWCRVVNIGNVQFCNADFNLWKDTTKTVYFNDLSTGAITDWFWDFGDGDTSVVQNPSHTYSAAGTYWVCLTVESDTNCTDTWCKSVTVDVDTSCFTLSSASTDASCAGSCNGSATVTVNGGTSPFTYSWSNGKTTTSVTGLCAGTYTVSIVDSIGCYGTLNAIIGEPAALSLSVSVTDANCGSPDGDATVSASGGTGSYTYLWNDPNTQTTGIATGLAAGNYTVTVKDSNSCTKSAMASVSDAGGPTISVTANNVSACAGDNDGSIDINVSGGTLPYAYLWSTGDTIEDITNLTAGSYSVTVTDSAGCTANASATINEPSGMSLAFVITDANCGGANGSAAVTVIGGTAPYGYFWSTGDTNSTITGLSPGVYTVTITDANNCIDSADVVISNIGGATITGAITDVICNGGSDGEIDISVTGGTGLYLYTWSNAQVTEDITGLATGGYFVIVTDYGNGCMSVNSFTVDEPDVLSFTTSATDAHCSYPDGSATASVSGGAEPYTYTWSNGDSSETASGLDTGMYGITITDANGCTASDSVTVSFTVDIQPICIVTVDTASTKNIVVWEKPIVNGIDSFRVYRDIIGVYTHIGSVPYDSLSEFVDTTSGVDPQTTSYRYKISVVDSCGNESALSDYHETVHLTVNLGIPPAMNLIWDNYEGFGFGYYRILRDSTGLGNFIAIDSVTNSNTTYTDANPPSGNLSYIIEVVHATGCTATLKAKDYNSSKSNTSSISGYVQMSVTTTTTDATFGNCDGVATVTPSEGVPPYTYLWDSSAGSQTDSTATGLCAGTYNVTVYDAYGDSIVASVTVTELPATLSSVTTSINASQGNCDGTATVTASGGILPYTYLWDDTNSQTTQVATGLCAGSYSVAVYDANGDSVIASVTVGETGGILSATATHTDASYDNCDGTATVSVSGGYTPYTYLWNDPGSQTSTTATGLCEGTYTVTITDSIDSTITATVTISELPSTLTATAIATSTDQIPCNGTATADATGGNPPYTYQWDDPGSQPSITATGLCEGLYTVTVTDNSGSTTTASATVDVIPGISDVDNENRIEIYPNPNKGIFNLVIEMGEREDVTVEIFSLHGQLIYSEYVERITGIFTGQIDLSDYTGGIYHLQVTTDQGTVHKKVVIE
ncbi:MAG: PKD domain-containing protein [Bacteroidota bacterium]